MAGRPSAGAFVPWFHRIGVRQLAHGLVNTALDTRSQGNEKMHFGFVCWGRGRAGGEYQGPGARKDACAQKSLTTPHAVLSKDHHLEGARAREWFAFPMPMALVLLTRTNTSKRFNRGAQDVLQNIQARLFIDTHARWHQQRWI